MASGGLRPPDPLRAICFLKQFCNFQQILYYLFEKIVKFSKFFCPRRGCHPPNTLQKRLSSGKHGNERNKVFVYLPHFSSYPPPKKKSKSCIPQPLPGYLPPCPGMGRPSEQWCPQYGKGEYSQRNQKIVEEKWCCFQGLYKLINFLDNWIENG